ncbi:hypothetical protein SPBR_06991 [Sporothrix brasiliensis 5110]|uniref:Zn(2)-C6 fungal-type domain-containing protein n=1 Tax=Sporothrix brasiliensis 5110 TaxID=1398154 RepID=A0A0C2EQW8_9PEZI|nr:uncharacterized protein SPBR_06991 [Sporothrix brasiliensis 5110]KIH88729.1 hypothetical protein SPBR_06991 [Sporothrix brasiliensis 5110]
MVANSTPKTQVGEVRSAKRCWNCRDRKIACDRALPGCAKCKQRGKSCEGYGLRLSWPKDNDPRRSISGNAHYIQRPRTTGYEFVDASKQDIDLYLGDLTTRLDSRDPFPASYYAMHLARPHMTTLTPTPLAPASMGFLDPSLATIGHSLLPGVFSGAADQFDDLYSLLVRMSLTDDGPPALATRHALSALSYQTLGQKEYAYAHQATAIRALQVAIDGAVPGTDTVDGSSSSGSIGGHTNSPMQPSQYFQAMAASMLLNYYEILDDTSNAAATSSVYFCGCKRLAMTMHREHSTYQGDLALILDWVFYHDAMYKFSIHHWEKRTAAQVMIKDGPRILSKPVFSPLRHVVNPSLGCSLELLEILCQIVDAVLDPATPGYHSPEHLRALRQAEIRLDSVVQHVSTVSLIDPLDADITPPFLREPPQYQETESRLYAVCVKLYLQRLGRGVDKRADVVQDLLAEGYALLAQLGHCKRPWLLFVLGVEARDEDERRAILASIEAASAHLGGLPPPQNLVHVRRLVQAAWTHQDLHAAEASPGSPGSPGAAGSMLRVYNTIISANAAPPLFV